MKEEFPFPAFDEKPSVETANKEGSGNEAKVTEAEKKVKEIKIDLVIGDIRARKYGKKSHQYSDWNKLEREHDLATANIDLVKAQNDPRWENPDFRAAARQTYLFYETKAQDHFYQRAIFSGDERAARDQKRALQKKLRDFDEQLKKEGPPRRSTLSFTAGVAFDGEKHQWSENSAHRTRAEELRNELITYREGTFPREECAFKILQEMLQDSLETAGWKVSITTKGFSEHLLAIDGHVYTEQSSDFLPNDSSLDHLEISDAHGALFAKLQGLPFGVKEFVKKDEIRLGIEKDSEDPHFLFVVPFGEEADAPLVYFVVSRPSNEVRRST